MDSAILHGLLISFLKSSGFVAFAPIVNDFKVSMTSKLVLSLGLMLAIWPNFSGSGQPSIMGTLLQVASGCCLGIYCRLPFLLLHVSTSAFGQSFSLSQYLNTSHETSAGVVSEIYKWGVAITLLSFGAIWVAAEGLSITLTLDLGLLVSLLDWLTQVSLQVFAPFLAFSVMFNLLSGFVNRAMPQLMVMLVFAPLVIGFAFLFMLRFSDQIISVLLGQIALFYGF